MTDLTPEERLAFDIGFALKKSNRIKRARDEDPFPAIARHILEQLRLSGWRFEHPNTQVVFDPMPAVSLESYRELGKAARAALRMIREALEAHSTPGTLASEEHVTLEAFASGRSRGEGVDPSILAEAEVLVKALMALVARR
jgi:hypothetical protein